MRARVILAAAGALALFASPAQGQSAPPPRAAAPVEGENALFGGSSAATIVTILAIALAIFLTVADDNPDSP